MTLNSEQPWIGKIPANWRLKAIKRFVSTKVTDGPHETPEFEDDGIPFISAEAIKNNRIDFNLRRGFISRELYEQYSLKSKTQKGDILVVKAGATTGNAAYVDVDFEFGIWSPLAVIRCDERIAFFKFVYYVILSNVFRKQVELSWSFGTQQNIGMGVIERLKIPLPPLVDQKRIAAFLDSSCAAIDVAMNAKKKQVETLNELQKTAIRTAFAELNKYPIQRVKDLTTKIGSGVTPDGGAANYLDSGVPLLRSQNIYFDGLYLDDVAFISEETHASMSNSQLQPKDVLLNITGASIGRCSFVPEDFGEGNVNQHVCIVRPAPKIDHRYLAAFLSSPFGQDQILSSFTGASRQGLGQKELGLIRLPLPPHEIQMQVVAKVEKSNEMYKDLRDCIEKQIDVLFEYRKSLIHECVTGQRHVTEQDLKQV